MAFVRKIKAALVKQDSSAYVGEDTYLWYDIDTGCLRMYDGTPGGIPACGLDLAAIEAELQNIRDFIGKDTIGVEAPFYSSTLIITQNNTLENAISQLDAHHAPNPLEQGNVTIAPGATETVIGFMPILNSASTYVVSVLDSITGEYAVSELLGTYKALDNTVFHTQFNKLGDTIKYRPNIIYTSPNVEFIVTNNDTNTIFVSVTRIPTLSV